MAVAASADGVYRSPIPITQRKTLSPDQARAHYAAERLIEETDSEQLRAELRALRILQCYIQEWYYHVNGDRDPRRAFEYILRENPDALWPVNLPLPVRTLLDALGPR